MEKIVALVKTVRTAYKEGKWWARVIAASPWAIVLIILVALRVIP